jgi:hypothetical protein
MANWVEFATLHSEEPMADIEHTSIRAVNIEASLAQTSRCDRHSQRKRGRFVAAIRVFAAITTAAFPGDAA